MSKTRREVQLSTADMVVLEKIKQLEHISTDSGVILFCLDKIGRKWYPLNQKNVDLQNEIDELKQDIVELSLFVHNFNRLGSQASEIAKSFPLDNVTIY